MIEINARVNISAVVRVLFKIGEKAIVRKRYYSMYVYQNQCSLVRARCSTRQTMRYLTTIANCRINLRLKLTVTWT